MIPELGAIRARIRMYPVCDRRVAGGWCRKVAVSAAQLHPNASIGRDMESRCPDHAEPDAPRVCLGCRGEHHNTRDPYHCGACADREWGTPEDERW